MKLNITGSVFDTTGYSVHTRNLVNALYKINKEIHLETNRPADYIRWCNDAEIEMLDKNPFYQDGITIMIGVPPFWRIPLSENPKGFVGFLVFEGSECPIFWLEYLANPKVNQVWVPSNHVKQLILNTIEKYKGKNEKK